MNCAICIDTVESGHFINASEGCTHTFHRECLLKCIETENVDCPVCRQPITRDDTYRIIRSYPPGMRSWLMCKNVVIIALIFLPPVGLYQFLIGDEKQFPGDLGVIALVKLWSYIIVYADPFFNEIFGLN